jgi:hypothetical protein
MSRFILAFLVGLSTAAGQDLSIESRDYLTFGERPGMFNGFRPGVGIAIAEGWKVWRGGQSIELPFPEVEEEKWFWNRAWAQFSVPELQGSISSAVLRLPLSGRTNGRPQMSEQVDLVLHDVTLWPPEGYSRSPFPTDEELANKIATWHDFGNGMFYGMRDFSPDILTPYWSQHVPSSGTGSDGTFLPYYTSPPNYGIVSGDSLPFESWMFHGLGENYDDFYHDFRLSPAAVRDIANSSMSSWMIGAMLSPPTSLTEGEQPYSLNEYAAVYANEYPLILDLTYGPPPPLGDFSGNGRVDQSDLDFVLLNWGIFDQEELDAVLMTWGDGGLAAASVPEPAGVWIAAVVVIIAAYFRRRECPH